jgi:hypothetical protein
MIALYVDDIPAACNDTAWLASLKAKLGERFKIKDLGDLSQLVGMHITRDRSARTISLDQSKYLRDILAKYSMTDAKASSLPMDTGFLAGLAHMSSPYLTGVAKDVYPILMGSLQHAGVCTRPDVSMAQHPRLSPSLPHGRPPAGSEESPSIPPWHHRHAPDVGGGTDHNLQLTGFADADWANDNSTRKFRSGYLFTLGRGPISYNSKQQTYVAQSTCEAEYYSAADATKEDSNSGNLWGRSLTPPSLKPPPSWRTTKASLRTPRTPWSARRPSTSV